MNRLLDRLLVTLEARLEAFALLAVARDQRLVFDGLDAVIVHYVLSGEGWLDVKGAKPLRCSAGSILIVPPGKSQSLRASDNPKRDIDAVEHCAMVKDGLVKFGAASGGEGDLRVLCGSIIANAGGSFGLFDTLKQPLLEDFTETPFIQSVFAMLRDEVASPAIGARALVGSLMKLALVTLVRRHIDQLASSPLLKDVEDERLLRAVAAVLDMPAGAHTVASLARIAGMSRSSFARMFADQFSQTPMEFVAKTRLHHAAELLRSTDLPVKVVAASIGFQSRSHFSRAFRAAYGHDPKSFRDLGAAPVRAPKRLAGSRRKYALTPEPEKT